MIGSDLSDGPCRRGGCCAPGRPAHVMKAAAGHWKVTRLVASRRQQPGPPLHHRYTICPAIARRSHLTGSVEVRRRVADLVKGRRFRGFAARRLKGGTRHTGSDGRCERVNPDPATGAPATDVRRGRGGARGGPSVHFTSRRNPSTRAWRTGSRSIGIAPVYDVRAVGRRPARSECPTEHRGRSRHTFTVRIDGQVWQRSRPPNYL